MPIQEELEDYFKKDVWTVVEDAEKFKRKLNIGADAFKWLTTADNLGTLLTAIVSGTGITGIVFFTWFSSLGILGQIGLTLGFLGTPVGWLALAGAGSAVMIFLTGHIFRGFKKDTVTVIPNFINTPLDLLGSSIAELLCSILLKIAHADDDYCDAEREKIELYFSEEWGFSNTYIKMLLNDLQPKVDAWEWSGLGDVLKGIAKTGDLKFETMSAEIIRITNEVIVTDGKVHPKEMEEVMRLKKALQSKGTLSSMKQWLNSDKPSCE